MYVAIHVHAIVRVLYNVRYIHFYWSDAPQLRSCNYSLLAHDPSHHWSSPIPLALVAGTKPLNLWLLGNGQQLLMHDIVHTMVFHCIQYVHVLQEKHP
jgi:hypothetical protein